MGRCWALVKNSRALDKSMLMQEGLELRISGPRFSLNKNSCSMSAELQM